MSDRVTARDLCEAYPEFHELALDLPLRTESLKLYAARMRRGGCGLSWAGDPLWLFLMNELTDDCEPDEWRPRLDTIIRQLEQTKTALLSRSS
jgi:hypothetical protein